MFKKELLRKKRILIGTLLCALFGLIACSESANQPTPAAPDGESLFEEIGAVNVDVSAGVIGLPEGVDSLVIGSLETLGGSHFFLATDDDPVDPAFDWDNPLNSGSVIFLTGDVRIVVLDDNNRIVKIWTVTIDENSKSSSSEIESSSSEKNSSSSEEKVPESSSNEVVKMSSSSIVEDRSSSSEVEESSSSQVEESSSSEVVMSSSSEEHASSSSEKQGIDVNALTVEGGTVFVSDLKVYVELPYGSDLTQVKFDQLDSVYDLIRPVEMQFELDGSEKTFSVVAGVQLPGSDFSKRDDSFWGTTSDAMAVQGSGSYKVVLDYTITIKSEANATFEDSELTLTTRTLTGSALGGMISGGWKMAGGFYFAGSYTGTDAASIYIADNQDAGADNRPADFSQYMKHGKPFTARPESFEVKYSYNHVNNTNDTYPQSSLIYVLLLSSDQKIVAAGCLSDSDSVKNAVKTIPLKYGSDAGLLNSGYPGTTELKVGSGEEYVASIRVMFASSALAYIADGGTSSQMKKNFRGGENSQLILDEFKLIY